MNFKSVMSVLVLAALVVACKKSPTIAFDSPGGMPGDMATLRITNGTFEKSQTIKIASQNAVVVSASDSAVSIIIPAIEPQSAEVTVIVGGKTLSAKLDIQGPDTEHLWFTLNGKTVTFKDRQVSREQFMRDKSHTSDKLLFEFLDSKNEVIAITFIDNPGFVEVPTADGRGLSMVERKGDVPFYVTVPILRSLAKVRVSSISLASKGEPVVITELAIPAR